VDDVEPLAGKPVELQLLGQPRREAQDRRHGIVPCDAGRHRTAHREADE
jgi:hypothetical protein